MGSDSGHHDPGAGSATAGPSPSTPRRPGPGRSPRRAVGWGCRRPSAIIAEHRRVLACRHPVRPEHLQFAWRSPGPIGSRRSGPRRASGRPGRAGRGGAGCGPPRLAVAGSRARRSCSVRAAVVIERTAVDRVGAGDDASAPRSGLEPAPPTKGRPRPPEPRARSRSSPRRGRLRRSRRPRPTLPVANLACAVSAWNAVANRQPSRRRGDEVERVGQPNQVEVGGADRDLLGERAGLGEAGLGLIGAHLRLHRRGTTRSARSRTTNGTVTRSPTREP